MTRPSRTLTRLLLLVAAFALGLALCAVGLRLEYTPAELLALVGLALLINVTTPLCWAWRAWRVERRKQEPFPYIAHTAEVDAAFAELNRAHRDATRAFMRWQTTTPMAHGAFDDDDTAEIVPCETTEDE